MEHIVGKSFLCEWRRTCVKFQMEVAQNAVENSCWKPRWVQTEDRKFVTPEKVLNIGWSLILGLRFRVQASCGCHKAIVLARGVTQ